MSNLALIQPQRVDFDTTQATDWLDGLPVIGAPGFGGLVAGSANVGNGTLAVPTVVSGTAYGAHEVTVTSIASGLVRLGVTDPDGVVTGRGVAGVPLYAGGLTLLATPGSVPFAVGDSFAVGVVPVAIDLTGLQFDLDARTAASAATIALQATSAGAGPTIANGGVTGTIAMAVRRATMARTPVKADGYPYAIFATDPASGLRVPAFYGLIHHTAIPAQIGQG
ncbi:hypothetical protein [Methylobacterium brachiatum]|uniref:hypothetical protein n=1 Tax=Methylobacterium brachiatum TaxID=269660 RepID=UPI00244688E2|nr:hypothetical protein [Methylobacterium brachiatum]MDH2313160.1 hypothetical protein [Methylobacterium brachiatum]